jgi:hypothetical protein
LFGEGRSCVDGFRERGKTRLCLICTHLYS